MAEATRSSQGETSASDQSVIHVAQQGVILVVGKGRIEQQQQQQYEAMDLSSSDVMRFRNVHGKAERPLEPSLEELRQWFYQRRG